MKRALLIIVIPVGILMIIHALLLDGLDGVIWSLIHKEDTQYSQEYTDTGFRKIEVGMAKEHVLFILGRPLFARSYENDKEYWYYSTSPNDTHYRIRIIVFSPKGFVIKKVSEYYVD